MSFKPLYSLLHKNVQAKGVTWQVEAAMALGFFDEIVTELWQGKMKDRARAMYVKDQILTVAVLSPVLAQELRLKQNSIVDFINKKAGREIVTRLRFMS